MMLTRLKGSIALQGLIAPLVLLIPVEAWGKNLDGTPENDPDEPDRQVVVPAAPPALDEDCTVSLLNRTTRVNPDGTFLLPNVPSSTNLIRASVLCVRDGGLLGGVSEFFQPLPNSAITIEFPQLGPIPPSVATLVIGGPDHLDMPGLTTQLTVTATLSNGDAIDVTSGAQGTSFVSSNSEIATVSTSGLVTAGDVSGTASISVVNDGVFASRSVQVVLEGDGDSDGIPDDFEESSLCLDPAIADGSMDADGDGLSNLEEFNLGTDPCNPDTDGDGLADGAEVGQGSNPLLADSDFDGVLDGIEPDGDFDGDGTPNFLDPDSDDDGLPDGVEFAISGSIAGANPFVDNDGDGLLNIDEVALSTDPLNPDSDGDGLPDGLEAQKGTDALVADNTAPTIEILDPLPGIDLVEDDSIDVAVDASDDGLVSTLELLVNGTVTDSIPVNEMMVQTTFDLRVPIDVPNVELRARAFDTNANVASANVVFPVIEDPLTAVIGNVVGEDALAVEGAMAAVRTPSLPFESGTTNLLQGPYTTDPVTNIGVADISGAIAYTPGIQPFLGEPVDLASEGLFDVSGTITVDFTGFDPSAPTPLDGVIDLTAVAQSGFQKVLQATFENFLPAAGTFPAALEFDVVASDPTGTILDVHPLTLEFSGTVNIQIDPNTLELISAELDGEVTASSRPDFSGLTDANGDFTIPGVATILGDIVVDARAENGSIRRGSSAPASAVRGGTTDVGQIVIAALGPLYASDPRNRTLLIVDPETGQGSVIGQIGTAGQVTEIEWSPDGATLYATTGGGSSTLATIDPETGGVLTTVGHPFGALNGLEFDQDGNLLGTFIPFSGQPSNLVVVNVATGALTTIGPTGFGPIGGLAFSPDFGTLYGVTSGQDVPAVLLTIDPLTGAGAPIASLDLLVEVSSLEATADGRLLVGADDGNLYEVDPGTGAATLMGPTGQGKLSGLSFRPQ